MRKTQRTRRRTHDFDNLRSIQALIRQNKIPDRSSSYHCDNTIVLYHSTQFCQCEADNKRYLVLPQSLPSNYLPRYTANCLSIVVLTNEIQVGHE